MKARLLALTAGLMLLGAGPAAAGTPLDGQMGGQSADSHQTATSSATSTQTNPSNDNISVRVLSPGNDGDVTQSNSSRALSFAGNLNHTTQTIDSSGPGSGQAGQDAANDQSATSTATSTQDHPSNRNISVRVLSEGDNGSVDQSNDSTARSFAGNKNNTTQEIEGSGGPYKDSCGCAKGSEAIQAGGQDAYNEQHATSTATSTQDHPSNRNISVRVLSDGDNGDVEQSNDSTARSFAGNRNELTQSIDQGSGGPGGLLCGCRGSTEIQAAGQDAANWQSATSSATSTQSHPSNENKSVRVLSEGDDGDVVQSNSSKALSFAGNKNETSQDISQGSPKVIGPIRALPPAKCCEDSLGIHAAGQRAFNWQDATSTSTSRQYGAKNENKSIRVKHSDGSGGDVSQWNGSFAGSAAFNKNRLTQSIGYGRGKEMMPL